MRLTLLFPAAATALLLATTADAQGKAASVAQAERLFDEAKTLLENNRAPEACARFDESQKLDPQLGTLLNLALCNEQIGKTASAWALFNEVIGLATRAGQAKRVDLAKRHALALEPALSRANIDLQAAPLAIVLRLDGEPLDLATRPTLRIPVDPGKHTLVASAPNHTPATITFDAPKGPGETPVVVPPLASISATSSSGPPTDQAPADHDGPPWKTIGIVAGGVGAGALIFGLVAGGVALGKSNTASADCPNVACNTSAGYDANQSAHTWATVSTVSVVAGVALIALGGVMIFVLPSERAKSAAANVSRYIDVRF